MEINHDEGNFYGFQFTAVLDEIITKDKDAPVYRMISKICFHKRKKWFT